MDASRIGGLAAGISLAVILGNDLLAPRGSPLAVRAAAVTAAGLVVVSLGLGIWNRITVSYATLADWLQAVEEAMAKDPRREFKLAANVPYCIATPVISNLL